MPAHTKPWFRSFDLHTQSFMQASSAISFRLPPDSISAAASSGSPLLSSPPCGFISGFSGLSIPRFYPLPFHFLTPAVFAFFRLLQFWVLTTQPLFLPFLLFLLPPHSGFHSAPFSLSLLRFSPLFPAWFPMHSFPVSVLGIAVCFLSSFLASLPQPFHECLPSSFDSGLFPFHIRFFRPFCFRF